MASKNNIMDRTIKKMIDRAAVASGSMRYNRHESISSSFYLAFFPIIELQSRELMDNDDRGNSSSSTTTKREREERQTRIKEYNLIHTQIIGSCRIDIGKIEVEICNYLFPVEPNRPSHTRMRPATELYGC